jgi:hypothetical protein
MRSEIGAIIKQYTPRDPRMESGVAGAPEIAGDADRAFYEGGQA